MPLTEEGRENGSALMVIGWVCALFALVVFFFNPAALKRGQFGVEWITGALLALGAACYIVGWRIRAHHR